MWFRTYSEIERERFIKKKVAWKEKVEQIKENIIEDKIVTEP